MKGYIMQEFKCTNEQYDGIFELVDKVTKNTTVVKLPIESLSNLLEDHSDLLHQHAKKRQQGDGILKVTEMNALTDAIKNVRKGSKFVKVSTTDITKLLFDHGELHSFIQGVVHDD